MSGEHAEAIEARRRECRTDARLQSGSGWVS